MANYFYYDSNGNQFGPVSETELKKRNLPASTLVTTRGMKQCKPLSEVFPEIKDAFNTKISSIHSSTYDKPKERPTNSQSMQNNTRATNSSVNTTFTTHPKPKKTGIEEDQLYKQNIMLLIMIFLFFIPCTIVIEFLTLANMPDDIEPGGSGPGKAIMTVILFGMKYWPIISMLVALVCSIIGLKDADERKKYITISFVICCATIILGIIMIFNPGLALGIVAAVIVLLLIIGWLASQKD